MAKTKKQLSSYDCIICGVENPLGVKAHFYETDHDSVITHFKFKNEHQSYPGRAHGGMICAMLDELVGRAIWIKHPDMWGVTMTINVKYRKTVPLESPLVAEGRIVSETSRTFTGTGEIRDQEGNILAEAEAVYMKLPLSKIADEDNERAKMFMVEDDN